MATCSLIPKVIKIKSRKRVHSSSNSEPLLDSFYSYVILIYNHVKN